MNKLEIFSSVVENCYKHLECFPKCMEITPCCTHLFLSDMRFKEGCKKVKDDYEWNWGLIWASKAVGGYWSSVDCFSDWKSADHEKWQCSEEYHWRFGLVWKIMELSVLSIRQLLVKRNITILEQPSYSPDLSVCDFVFSPSSKGSSRGPILKRAITMELRGILEESFQQRIEAWQRRIGKSIRLEWGLLWRRNHVVCCLELKKNCLWHKSCYFSDTSWMNTSS